MASPQDYLTPIKQQKVYTQIVEQFILLIERGEFTPGLHLPPERELARQLGVSRASLRESLTVMQMMGLVETLSGQGTFISNKPKTAPLNYSMPNMGESPSIILQARKVFEPVIAALAATQRKQESLQKLADILAWVESDHSKEQVMGEGFSEGDRQFHLEIACATGNPILISTEEMIHDLMGQQLWLALMRHTSFTTPGRFEEAMKEHHNILDAIRNRDAQLASIRVKAHLLRVEKVMEQADLGLNVPAISLPLLKSDEE
jgi:GntR family transcriptional regulator, transcriptional repressor for pyruvate dehydrogenase complex